MRTSLTTGLCIHLGAGCLEGGVELVHGSVATCEVLCLVGILELLQSSLDGCLLVGGELVAQVLELVLGLEDHAVGLVELVHLLALLAVGLCVGLGLGLHALDLLLAEAR